MLKGESHCIIGNGNYDHLYKCYTYLGIHLVVIIVASNVYKISINKIEIGGFFFIEYHDRLILEPRKLKCWILDDYLFGKKWEWKMIQKLNIEGTYASGLSATRPVPMWKWCHCMTACDVGIYMYTKKNSKAKTWHPTFNHLLPRHKKLITLELYHQHVLLHR